MDDKDNNVQNRGRRVVGPGLFVGLWITTLGVIFLLDQLGIIPAHVSFQFVWPLILIVAGLATVFSNRFWGGLFLVIGTILLANELGFVHVHIGSLWPLILIALGIWMLLGSSGTGWGGLQEWRDWNRRTRGSMRDSIRNSIHDSIHNSVRDSIHNSMNNFASCGSSDHAPGVNTSTSDDSTFDHSVVLSGFKRRVTSTHFRFGRVVAVLGGFQIDFTHADIEGDQAELRIETVFGGGEVRVPDTWLISIEAQSIAGAFVDETYPAPNDAAPKKRLVVRGAAVFGGVNFKN